MSEAKPVQRRGITLGTKRSVSPEELAAEEARVIEDNFPKHRTLYLKPLESAIQYPNRVEIVVTEEVLLATAHHVAQDTSKESGGFLLGNRYLCPNTNRQYIVIDQFMRADYTEGTQVSLTFTTNSWAQLKDRMSGKYLGKNLVGWYHSHPGMGIFLSNYDLDIHKNRFSNEWDVALVLDPVKHEGGFFGWADGNINPREKLDFYELLEGDSRETVVAWTNYTAEDPKTGLPAPLKSVNTKNSDGHPVSPNLSRSPAKASGDLMSNPYLLIGGAAALVLFLLASLAAGYWFLSRKSETDPNNANSINTDQNKVLISKRIRVDNLKGYLSSTSNEMTVKMQIKNIGGSDVVDEVHKNNSLVIMINDLPTSPASEVNNGVLEVSATAILPPGIAETLKKGDKQDFSMRVEMGYNDESAAKIVTGKFQKGTAKSDSPSLGDSLTFTEMGEDSVAPTKLPPRPKVVSNPAPPPANPADDKPKPPATVQKPETSSKPQKPKPTDNQAGTTDGPPLDKAQKEVERNVSQPIKKDGDRIKRKIQTTGVTGGKVIQ